MIFIVFSKTRNYKTFQDMNDILVTFGPVKTPDTQNQKVTHYEPIMQSANVGSKMQMKNLQTF